MKRIVTFLLVYMAISIGYGQEKKYVTVKRAVKLMGSDFEITVVAQNEEIGYINIEEAVAEISRVEKMISSWDPQSETSLINSKAGINPVKVSFELYKLIERSILISELTDGAFDITSAVMDKVWQFDRSMEFPPSPEEIHEAASHTGYRKIVLNAGESTVFLKEKGMKIGFGGIGKGFAADKTKELLVSKQVPAGMINAGGDITTWGTKATGEKWLIGIDNPQGKGNFFSWIPLLESSVSISGNEDQYITFNEKRYSNIINPVTGYPSYGISKVTVLSRSAEFCDALGTAVYVLGKDKALAMINQLPGTEAIIVDIYNQMFKSNGVLLSD